MKSLLASFAVLFITLIPLHAQEEAPKVNSLLAKAWALQFQVGSNFTLKDFQGATISWKWHLERKKAIRVGVTVNGSFTDVTKNSDNTTGGVITNSALTTQKSDSQNIALSLQYIYYPLSTTSITLFMGFGPVVSFGRMHSELGSSETGATTGDRTTATEDRKSWTAGATTTIGAEWFMTRRLSLHAEYGIVIEHFSGKEKYTTETTMQDGTRLGTIDNSTKKFWTFDPTVVRFGVSVYF